jgi:hypothetical protein
MPGGNSVLGGGGVVVVVDDDDDGDTGGDASVLALPPPPPTPPPPATRKPPANAATTATATIHADAGTLASCARDMLNATVYHYHIYVKVSDAGVLIIKPVELVCVVSCVKPDHDA